MATANTGTASSPGPAGEAPPLQSGDRLWRTEFERRYNAMPGLKKAELIEGVVYMPSPVKRLHGRPHLLLGGWLTNYLAQTPGLDAADNATVRFDDENEPQPDLLLVIEPASGGQSRVDEDGYYAGPPEFIAEVAASSVSYDLHAKKHAYQRAGVREYLLWRARDGEIDWFRLEQGNYVAVAADEAGITKSDVFPGLWLDRAALLRGDLPRVFAVLQEGIASAGHESFVQMLRAKRGG